MRMDPLPLFPLKAIAALILVLAPPLSAQRLQPSDLTYLGAFRLPETTTDYPAVWDWSGEGMTYCPSGDAAGPVDGFPGSLFATGNAQQNWVGEFGVPAPSLSRDVGSLQAARVLQSFADVRGGLFPGYAEQPRVGMEYLPVGSGRTEERLYLAWGQHYQMEPGVDIFPTHAWCGLDLDHAGIQGPWWVGTQAENDSRFTYSVNEEGLLTALRGYWEPEKAQQLA